MTSLLRAQREAERLRLVHLGYEVLQATRTHAAATEELRRVQSARATLWQDAQTTANAKWPWRAFFGVQYPTYGDYVRAVRYTVHLIYGVELSTATQREEDARNRVEETYARLNAVFSRLVAPSEMTKSEFVDWQNFVALGVL